MFRAKNFIRIRRSSLTSLALAGYLFAATTPCDATSPQLAGRSLRDATNMIVVALRELKLSLSPPGNPPSTAFGTCSEAHTPCFVYLWTRTTSGLVKSYSGPAPSIPDDAIFVASQKRTKSSALRRRVVYTE
jgi:hypothetical protein